MLKLHLSKVEFDILKEIDAKELFITSNVTQKYFQRKKIYL